MSKTGRDDGLMNMSSIFLFRAHRWPVETLAAEAFKRAMKIRL
jgi:hypothetical protein